MIRRSSLCIGALAIWIPAVAGAQAPQNKVVVSLTVDACVRVDVAEVRRMFRLELATSLPNAVEGNGKAATRVTATCKGKKVELQVIDSLTAKVLVRRIELGTKGRERLLALAVMELLVASWVELAATKNSSSDADRVAKARKDASRFLRRRLHRQSWEITTTLHGGVSFGSIGLARGGALSVNLDAPNGFGWGVDMSLERATESFAAGAVSVSAFAAAVSVHVHRKRRGMRLRGAIGARVGGVTMAGDPTGPNVVGRSLTGFAGGPFGRVSASKAVIDKVMLELWVESGYHMFPVHGVVNGNEQASVQGAWLAAHLGVGWQW